MLRRHNLKIDPLDRRLDEITLDAHTMQLELVIQRACARGSSRRATCASHAARTDGHEGMRGVPGRVRIATQCHAVSEHSTSTLAHLAHHQEHEHASPAVPHVQAQSGRLARLAAQGAQKEGAGAVVSPQAPLTGESVVCCLCRTSRCVSLFRVSLSRTSLWWQW